MANIKDVAKLAGVSVATVSRVLNNENIVVPETQERVHQAISALQYTPNMLGRDLRRLKTKRILVLLNTISNQFYSKVVKGIEEAANEHGYSVMICMTHGDVEIQQQYLNLLKNKLVDGAVFLTVEGDGYKLSDELKGFCVVQACEYACGFETPMVSIDNEKAAFEAVNYLIDKGHRKIAYLGAGSIYQSSISRDLGYRRALQKAGLEICEKWILDEGFSFNSGMKAANILLSKKELPTALFCVSDTCAAGVIKAFAQNEISTPNDISVMGFDDTQISQIYIPSITTTRQPRYDIGYNAMQLLLKKINNEEIPNNKIILEHSIIERESVKDIRSCL